MVSASAPDLEPVWADPVLVEQVLINLVRNACDAMVGQAANRRILITAARIPQQGFVKVTVSDSGPGLGGKTIDQLCAAFFPPNPMAWAWAGHCRSIIELHPWGTGC